MASKDLLVVGAYPPSGKYEEYKGSAEEHFKALQMVSKVRLPARDPAYGKADLSKSYGAHRAFPNRGLRHAQCQLVNLSHDRPLRDD
jgi:hypothetical protein